MNRNVAIGLILITVTSSTQSDSLRKSFGSHSTFIAQCQWAKWTNRQRKHNSIFDTSSILFARISNLIEITFSCPGNILNSKYMIIFSLILFHFTVGTVQYSCFFSLHISINAQTSPRLTVPKSFISDWSRIKLTTAKRKTFYINMYFATELTVWTLSNKTWQCLWFYILN